MEFVFDTEITEILSDGKETTPETAFIDTPGLETRTRTEKVEPTSNEPELGEKDMEAPFAAWTWKAKARRNNSKPVPNFTDEITFVLAFSIVKNRQ